MVGRRAIETSLDYPRTPQRDRYGFTPRNTSSSMSSDNTFTPRSTFSHESSTSSDFSESSGLRSWELNSSQEFSNSSYGNSPSMVCIRISISSTFTFRIEK